MISIFWASETLKIFFDESFILLWSKVLLKASDMFVLLPVNNLDQVAFDFMEHYIEAVEKICIRSIVVWKDKIIETTKTMVNQVP